MRRALVAVEAGAASTIQREMRMRDDINCDCCNLFILMCCFTMLRDFPTIINEAKEQ